MTRKHLLTPCLIAIFLSAPAGAAIPPAPQPEVFQAMLRCRSIADSANRLACFDKATAAFEQAATSRDVLVVDRAQIRQTRRSLFGLNLPNLSIFGGKNEHEEEVTSIEGVIASAQQDGFGNWLVRLEDGGTWHQTDSRPLGKMPKRGAPVKINRGAMGSYMMRVDGQPGIRVKREM